MWWSTTLLTQDDKWNELADVILANPPFMSPKGGIKPHKRFSVQATRSEVLFVDYMAEHLTATGRAAIVVPEGIIFQSGTAYKALRKMLVEGSLVAVVSLPAGVFNPYSGVKTSILFLDKRVHKQTDSVLFVKVQNDGFNLGAQRRAVAGSDLAEATRLLRSWMVAPQAFEGNGVMAQVVARSTIGTSGDFNLSGERYVAIDTAGSDYPLMKLDELCLIERGGSPRPIQDYMTTNPNGINWIKIGDAPANAKYISSTKEKIKPEGALRSRAVKPGDFILSNSMSFGRPYIMATDGCIHDGWLLLRTRSDNLLKDYLYLALGSSKVYEQFVRSATGGVVNNLNIGLVKEVSIPLPPLEVQQQIVAEIEGYQKVIAGARQVLDGYKPQIVPDVSWPVQALADICSLSSGGTPSKANLDFWTGSIPWVSAKDMKMDCLSAAQLHVSEAAVKESSTRLIHPGSLLILVRGMGLANGVPICEVAVPCAFNQDVKAIKPASHVSATFLRLTLQQQSAQFQKIMETAAHGTLKINTADLLKMQIPLPDLSTQRAIVAEIEAEQALVNANRELIRRMEAKIKAAIDRVWGSDQVAAVASTTPAATSLAS